MVKFNENNLIPQNQSILEKVNNPSLERQIKIKEIENFVRNLPELPHNPFCREPYSKQFQYICEKRPEVQKILAKKLTNETVIDLGCGFCDYVLCSLDKFNIKEYIGVDNNFPNLEAVKKENLAKKEHHYGIDYIESDMLTFLSKLPDNSVHIIMNGIDQTIIRDHQYWGKLEKEITRVVKRGGIFTGYDSAYNKSIELSDFNKLYSGSKKSLDEYYFLLEKK
ncbi:MAG: class I SAM-dependent methyltransferase [Candidatus Shapirobacteria bacterium]|jgi:ubiquinone/menaquinone biosynthesis C-methylase UbiE